MKTWPVPESYLDVLPKKGTQGSFWENRNDRYHCGVDIYAPQGSKVVAIDPGRVISVIEFTQSSFGDYLETTQCVIIKNEDNIIYKYAGLVEVSVRPSQKLKAGEVIGTLGKGYNLEKVTSKDPFYVRELQYSNKATMLHLEIYKAPIVEVRPYNTGNFLGNEKPDALIDPEQFLFGITK